MSPFLKYFHLILCSLLPLCPYLTIPCSTAFENSFTMAPTNMTRQKIEEKEWRREIERTGCRPRGICIPHCRLLFPRQGGRPPSFPLQTERDPDCHTWFIRGSPLCFILCHFIEVKRGLSTYNYLSCSIELLKK